MASPSIPERYVQLGLRLGKHLDGLVDGYFGPPELKDTANAEEPADPRALGEPGRSGGCGGGARSG